MILLNDQGLPKTSSCLAFTGTQRLVGDLALNQISRNSESTIFSFKRIIGRNLKDSSLENTLKFYPYSVTPSPKNRYLINAIYKYKQISAYPEEITAMLLQNLKETAERHTNQEAKNAIISVPSFYSILQRQAILDAGKIAGFKKIRLVNESSAAYSAFLLYRADFNQKNVIIFDLGGGKLDVGLFWIQDGKSIVKAVSGDFIGGDDFDNRILE